MTEVFISLGTNLGNKKDNLAQAVKYIAAIPGVNLASLSSLYETEPWGKTDQDVFLNQVVKIETDLSASKLLGMLNEIEIKMGRQRVEKWGPRIIDLDILLYGKEVINSEDLVIPHSRMRERLFVLVPLKEICADLIFPDDGTEIEEVLDRVLAREGNKGIKRI
ncbi:2-amino-4-hydroxy-6-hydroxymethyldihydropteridine diphosphokinase [Syntrophomonas erecta]